MDVDLGAVGDAQLEFPGGAIMSLRIAPKEKISGKADRSVRGHPFTVFIRYCDYHLVTRYIGYCDYFPNSQSQFQYCSLIAV